MSISAYVRTIIHGVGETVDMRQNLSGTAGQEIEETIVDAADDLVSLAFALADLIAFYMVSSGTMTVKTNGPGAPPTQETIALAAGMPFVYIPGAGLDSPFAGDVSALYVTNTGTATLQIRVLSDATP